MLISSNKIVHNDVVHFCCTKAASFVITSGAVENFPSIVDEEEKPYRKLVHFYKQKGVFSFIKEEEIDVMLGKCPELVFATRHPLKDFKEQSKDAGYLPDLEELIGDAGALPTNKGKPFEGVISTLTGKPILQGPLYVAKTLVDGQVKEVYATQEEVLDGGAAFDLQPLVFYRMTGPILDHAVLPAIDADKVFHRSSVANESLRFSISNADIDADEIMDIDTHDQAFAEMMDKLTNFDEKDDFAILGAIDRQIAASAFSLKEHKKHQFDPRKLLLASNNRLKKMDVDEVSNRISLLFQFS